MVGDFVASKQETMRPHQKDGVRLELWGTPSMDAPWAWVAMRLR